MGYLVVWIIMDFVGTAGKGAGSYEHVSQDDGNVGVYIHRVLVPDPLLSHLPDYMCHAICQQERCGH